MLTKFICETIKMDVSLVRLAVAASKSDGR